MSNDIEREAFEKAMRGRAGFHWQHHAGQYSSTVTQRMWATWQAARAQGEPSSGVPEGYALIPLHNGNPEVTNEMKVECIGEFSWQEEAPHYDEDGEVHDYVATHVVPWSVCKAIYKKMAGVVMLTAAPTPEAGQGGGVPMYVCHSCGNETPPPPPFSMCVRCRCGHTTAATIAADLAKHTQPAKQGSVPEGWRLVPIVPTKSMQDVWDIAPTNECADQEFIDAYQAMLDVAPQPPQDGE